MDFELAKASRQLPREGASQEFCIVPWDGSEAYWRERAELAKRGKLYERAMS